MIYTKIKYGFLTLLILFTLSNHAQTIIISGKVINQSSGLGIANKAVSVYANLGLGQSYNLTAFTDNKGYFLDSLFLISSQNTKFYLSVTDCNNNVKTDSFLNTSSKMFIFQICDNTPPNCKSEFFAYQDTANPKKIIFTNLSTTNTNKWNWIFGDGQSSNMKEPVHTYINPGKYSVSLIAYDTVSNCSKHFYDTVYAGIPTPAINSTFTYGINAMQITSLGSVNTTLPTGYKWNFGDNTYATGKLVNHTYSNPGTYTVTLKTITIHPQTLLSFVSTTSKIITVSSNPSAAIYGQVISSTFPTIDKGRVILYKFNNGTNHYTEVAKTDIKTDTIYQLSYYYFASVPYGTYLTKAVPDSLSNLYNTHAPTYCNNSVLWGNATSFIHNSSGQNHAIYLKLMIPSVGQGSISGHVYDILQSGNPVSNVNVFLKNEFNDLVAYTKTNQNGEYEFKNLAMGMFSVYADTINVQATQASELLNLSNPVHSSVNIFLNSLNGMNEAGLTYLKIYPNPAKDKLNIKIAGEEDDDFSLKIYNLSGQLLLTKELKFQGINPESDIDISAFEDGFYLLSISSKNVGLSTLRFAVIK